MVFAVNSEVTDTNCFQTSVNVIEQLVQSALSIDDANVTADVGVQLCIVSVRKNRRLSFVFFFVEES